MKSWLMFLLALSLLTGCVTATPPLPTVEWNTLEDARQILIDRQAAIESVQAQLKLKITSPPPERETNTLDAALVIQGDDHFRLRAWKLNQTIFDLTATPDGTFIVANEEMKKRAPEAEHDLGRLTEQLGAMLRGLDWATADLSENTSGYAPIIVAGWDHGRSSVDARSLAPMGYQPLASDSVALEQLQTQYAQYDNGIWYKQITAVGDFGTVEMTFRDVELNGELNPRAFKPLRRALRVDETGKAENTSP